MTVERKQIGSRWLWMPHANAYLGLDNKPEECEIVAYTTHAHPATRSAGPIGPYDYIVKVGDGLRFYAFDSSLTPLKEGRTLRRRHSSAEGK